MCPPRRIILFLLFCLTVISISHYVRSKYQKGIKIEKRDTIFVEFSPCFKEPRMLITFSGSRIKDIFNLVDCKIKPVNSEIMEEVVKDGEHLWMDSQGHLYKGRMNGFKLFTLGQKMPLNEATAEELARIPGIGEELARRIVDHRQALTGFKDFHDVLKVKGVGKAKLNALMEYTYIE